MKLIEPDKQGFWLFTQASSIHWVDGKLPFGRADELGLTGLHAMRIGEWAGQPL